MYSSKAKNILCGVKGIHGESLFMWHIRWIKHVKRYLKISHGPTLSCRLKNHHCTASHLLEWRLKRTHYLFWDHTTHTTALRHSVDHAAGSAAMDMEISVTGSVHTWQCFLCCDASCIQWGLEFPADSPLVLQEAADKFGVNVSSQERHAPDSSSYIHYSQIEQERVNQSRLLHSALFFFSCPREQSDCVFGLFFFSFLLLLHTFKLSLSQKHIQSCLSVSEKITANYGSRLHWHCYCKVTRRRTAYKQPSVPTALPDVLVNVLNSRRVLLLLSPAFISSVTVQNVLFLSAIK